MALDMLQPKFDAKKIDKKIGTVIDYEIYTSIT